MNSPAELNRTNCMFLFENMSSCFIFTATRNNLKFVIVLLPAFFVRNNFTNSSALCHHRGDIYDNKSLATLL